MKTIYTEIDGKYYQMNQRTSLPNEMIKAEPGINSKVVVDAGDKRLTQEIVINTLHSKGIKSNKELYCQMIKTLKSDLITDIKVLPDFFKLYVDYTIYDNDREVDHSCVIRPVGPRDVILPLGVATNNETVYRRVKELHQMIEFRTRVPVPVGIVNRGSCRGMYSVKINNIILYLDTYGGKDNHESTYENPYGGNTSTILGSLDTLLPVFSTDKEGYDFDPTSVGFLPRVIRLDIDFIWSDLIVAYTSDEIDKIIEDNINKKYCGCDDDPDIDSGDDCGCDDGTLIPDPGTRPGGDGKEDPDNDGYFDYYERCRPTTPDALLVVENAMSDAIFKEDSMVRQKDVIKDIPDIEIGEYVLYCEVMDVDFI